MKKGAETGKTTAARKRRVRRTRPPMRARTGDPTPPLIGRFGGRRGGIRK